MSHGTVAEKWILASGNRGKVAELGALLTDFEIELVSQSELRIPPVAETGATFVENALLKARNAAAFCGLPALADDSGLVVDALDGAPGIRSARFAGPDASDTQNVAMLLDRLAGVPAAQRGARFLCTIVLLRSAHDPAPVIAQGKWEGQIAATPSGSSGFGYDPVFFDPVLGMTAAALDARTKNRVSHRGKALEALARALGAP